MAAAKATPESSNSVGSGGRPAQTEPQRVELDDSHAVALYANLCRVASTPEEVILDLALNLNPTGVPAEKIRVSQRVVLSHYTAKRLAALLVAAVQMHEQAFGILETDVRQRIKS